MSDTPARPLWTVEFTDRTLDQVLADRDRISASLVSLESSTTRRMLEVTPLAPASATRWEAARDAYRLLWEHFGAYGAVVDRAWEVRSRRARPGAADLMELADLLGGDSVELPAEAVTTVQRSMTAAPISRPALQLGLRPIRRCSPQ